MTSQRGSIIPVIAFLFGAAVLVGIVSWQFWIKDSDVDTSAVVDVNKVNAAQNANGNGNTNASNTNTNSNSNSNVNTNAAVDENAGMKTYTHATLNYTIEYPDTLVVSTCPGNLSVWFAASKALCDSEAPLSSMGVSPQDANFVIADEIARSRNNYPSAEVTTVAIAGVQATRIRVSSPTLSFDNPGNSDQVFLTYNGKPYIVYNTETGLTETRKTEFEKFFQSMKFN